MPTRARKPCAHGGCRALVRGSTYCSAHAQLHTRARSRADRAQRGTTSELGYDRIWQKVRAQHIAWSPLCVMCKARGWAVRAKDVDHIIPFEGRTDPLRLDPDNLQSLCRACHNAKTGRERVA